MENIDKTCLMLTLQPCRMIIDKALECLSDYDDLAVCKNHRLGADILEAIGKQLQEYYEDDNSDGIVPVIYHKYMLEAAEKIAETSRHIITSPGECIPISCKCEIESIRESLGLLMQSANNMLHSDGEDASALMDEIDKDKNFIEYAIASHSKDMRHDEFDEGSLAYYYLMLLYYLNSFIGSFAQVVKYIDDNNRNL